MEVKISVIVPFYNAEKFLRTSLDSAIGQTLRDIEIICVDDGSSDRSASIVAEYANRDARVKFIGLKHGGVSAARNAGIEAAVGEYVAFLDADDELLSDVYEKAYRKAAEGNCDVVQFGHCEVKDGKVSRTSKPSEKCMATDVRACPDIVFAQTKYIWDKLFRREMLNANGIRFRPYGYHEDHLFIFEVDLKGRNFAFVPDVGYRYAKTSEGAATRTYDERLLDCTKAYWDICRLARDAGLWRELAGPIWRNCSQSYQWRIWTFRNYGDKKLQARIVKDWFDFFEAHYPRWQVNMHKLGYSVILPPHDNLKVLLLGGTGALGAHLRDLLAEAGHDVFVTSRSPHEDAGRIRYIRGNAMDRTFFDRLMASHWDVIVDFMVHGPEGFQGRVDVMLNACDQYVFLSSSRVYANTGDARIVETSPRILDTTRDEEYLKTNEYALAKGREENVLRANARKNWTVIRPYVTFSEERLQLGTLEKEHWLKRALEGKPIVFSEDIAERTTTLTYGRDVARGMAAVIGKKEALGEVFHITSPKTVTWRKVLDLYVRILREVTGRPCPVVMTKTSCQLKTPGKYQVLFDRQFDRRFDNSKIGLFIDVDTFRDPMEALESCLRTFLKAPKFLEVKSALEAVHDDACAAAASGPVYGVEKPRYTVERNVQILIAALKAHGVRKVIASPGTTNLTFVASIQNDPAFEIYSAPDERSAAYMACGLAAESGERVVISCTGATASRNYLSGLTEAYYRKLPVLAVTGTLYEKRSGHLTAQFVDRADQPSDTVRLSVSMPLVRAKDDEWFNTVAANRAILELTRHGSGPVHINLETGHSHDYSVTKLPPVRVIRRHVPGEALPSLPTGKTAIFVGAHVPWREGLTRAVEAFCEKYDAPVFCDHASNYRGRGEMNFTLACYQQSGSSAAYRPDVLIHIGEVSGDYPSMKIVGASKVWRVSPDGEIRDTFRRLTDVFEMDEQTFFAHYAARGEGVSGNYRARCATHAADLLSRVPMTLPFSNIWIASQGSRTIPVNSVLHCGILNSFRSWSLFPLPKSVAVSCNTGGFGIDGCLSTALGASLAHPDQLHFVVLGDLAFFYDMNALGNRHVGRNLRILLVNNGKGVEFRNFNHPASQFGDSADRFVAAGGHYGKKSRHLVKHYAEDLGFTYMSASSKSEYANVARRFWSKEPSDRPMILEAFTDSVCDSDALERMTLIEGAAPYKPAPTMPVAPAKPADSVPVVAKTSFPKPVRAVAANRRIAILTFHTAFNCGAHLQAWALQTVLRRLGYCPEFPDCTQVGFFPRFDKVWFKRDYSGQPVKRFFQELSALGPEDRKRHRFRMFVKHCLNVRPIDIKDVEKRYGAVIVGSDQVWNSGITRKESSYYLTTMFKSRSLRRYSYAISVGDRMPSADRMPVLAAAARRFENVSVRENMLPNLVDRYGRPPVVDPDPTLLLTMDDFNGIAYPKRLERKPYLLVYSLQYCASTWKAAREMAKRMGLKPVIVQMYQYGRYGIADGKGVVIDISPDRFLAYFRDAAAVVTSSFHGTAFSLIYQKPFAVVPNVSGNVPRRSVEMLRKLHETVHVVEDPEDWDALARALSRPLLPATVEALRRLREVTLRNLKAMLPDLSKLPKLSPEARHLAVTWPFRKAWGGVKCLRENGVGYTAKHVVGKVLRFAGVRSRW